jgi:hypothetical protein
MPRARRIPKRRIGSGEPLDTVQLMDLLINGRTRAAIAGNVPAAFVAFASEEARRAAWEIHRDELLAREHIPGNRPAAWWDYEAPEPRDHREAEADQLQRLGLLTPDELAALAAPPPTREPWAARFDVEE